MASSSSVTHDAARSAFNVLTVAEDIFERIREEMSCEAAFRGKWEGTGKAMCNMHNARCTATTLEPRPRAGLYEQLAVSIVHSKNIAVMQEQNVKNRPSKHI
jgi:hypothetical protein